MYNHVYLMCSSQIVLLAYTVWCNGLSFPNNKWLKRWQSLGMWSWDFEMRIGFLFATFLLLLGFVRRLYFLNHKKIYKKFLLYFGAIILLCFLTKVLILWFLGSIEFHYWLLISRFTQNTYLYLYLILK